MNNDEQKDKKNINNQKQNPNDPQKDKITNPLKSPGNNKYSLIIVVVLAAILIYALLQDNSKQKEVDNKEFMGALNNGSITEVVIEGDVLNYKIDDQSYLTRWSQYDPDFKKELIEKTNGSVKEKVPSKWETILVSWLPFL
jgi:ATP-dependent Zn protease